MPQRIIALVDCNNFFVSCERLFRPDLANRPVVVLSSNDGCVVARSNEAKALGIPMGAPAFQHRSIFKLEHITEFSANFELYGDISQRITRLLTNASPKVEVYSVDESFLDLTDVPINSYDLWAQALKNRIRHEIGIPVTIGLGHSKVLAKLAAEVAKHDTPNNTVLNLINVSRQCHDSHLRQTPIQEVWGVGRHLAPQLRAEGIHNALDLAKLAPKRAQQLFGIHGRRLVYELNGQTCDPVQPKSDTRQSLMRGRMFGEDTNQVNIIEAAIVSLTSRAAHQLRQEKLLAQSAAISLSTNRHKTNYRTIINSVNLAEPTANPGLISSALLGAISSSLTSDLWFHRANIILQDLISEERWQLSLINNFKPQSKALLQALDSVNDRFGNTAVHLAAEDLSQDWHPKKRFISHSYTTSWQDLPRIT